MSKQVCLPFEAGNLESESSATPLDLSFWAAVDYCGFFRCTYYPGTMRMQSIFVNDTYARYSGLDAAELVAR